MFKIKFVLSALILFIFAIPPFQAHAGGSKIIIVGNDNYRHHNYSRYDNSHRLYNKYYFDRRAEGYRDRYGNKFKNRYYGNERYGYGESNNYSNRYYIRNNRGYCPY